MYIGPNIYLLYCQPTEGFYHWSMYSPIKCIPTQYVYEYIFQHKQCAFQEYSLWHWPFNPFAVGLSLGEPTQSLPPHVTQPHQNVVRIGEVGVGTVVHYHRAPLNDSVLCWWRGFLSVVTSTLTRYDPVKGVEGAADKVPPLWPHTDTASGDGARSTQEQSLWSSMCKLIAPGPADPLVMSREWLRAPLEIWVWWTMWRYAMV